MSHDTHTEDNSIREIDADGFSIEKLRHMAKGWKDPFPKPVVDQVTLTDGRVINVVRDDIPEIGSKGRFGSLFFERMQGDTLVYVAPRVGWAPISLAKLATMYGKRVVLFAPASKEPSHHQQVAMSLGAEMRFYRVAAMPNLQAKAKEFADKNGYAFAPLGLRHPLVTAAIVATMDRIMKGRKDLGAKQMWCAISTGVLSRGLQIALPDWDHRNVAVARNIKKGERGNATLYSHPFPFTQDEKPELRPPFPSAKNYDAKVWRYINEHAVDGAWMWNVAGEIGLQGNLPKKIQSDVAWGDASAFKRK